MPFTTQLNRNGAIAVLVLSLLFKLCCVSSFTAVLIAVPTTPSRLNRLQQSTSSDDSTIQLTKCSGEESDIQSVSSFMVDAFWLQSPQQLIQGGSSNDVSDSTRSVLLEEQARDLTEKYGERMGKRLLDSALITAVDGDSTILGAVGIEVCLIDKSSQEVIGATKSEIMIQNAVASLGPKQRRQYKNATVKEIATELLPPEISAICCLSNLCVSSNARRRGIAKKLCVCAEETASEWGYDEMFLKVEKDNKAAKDLYETKLGYQVEGTLTDEVALRVDPNAGFVETMADTLILKKEL